MGMEFILAFPVNAWTSKFVHLYIASTELNFSGFISSPHPGVSKNFSSTTGLVVLNLPVSVELPEGRSNRGIYIKTSRPVAVFGMDHYDCCVGEGFYVYPKESLGNHYTVFSMGIGYLAFVGTDDQTQVQITLNSTGTTSCNGRTYKNRDTLALSVNRMETVNIVSSSDLSGSIVQSTKPVAVISGASNVVRLAPSNTGSIFEYLIPSNTCGRQYIVPPLNVTKKFIIVFAISNDTTVAISGKALTTNETMSTDRMKEVQLVPEESYVLIADRSVCVYIFATSDDGEKNPMSSLLPSIDQFANNVVFPKPTIQVFSNYLSVIIKSQALSNLRINNKTISNTKIDKILLGNTEYSTFWIALPNDISTYHVWSISPYDRFGAIAYGDRSAEAYGYPAAINL